MKVNVKRIEGDEMINLIYSLRNELKFLKIIKLSKKKTENRTDYNNRALVVTNKHWRSGKNRREWTNSCVQNQHRFIEVPKTSNSNENWVKYLKEFCFIWIFLIFMWDKYKWVINAHNMHIWHFLKCFYDLD